MTYLGAFHAQHFEWFNRNMGSMEIGRDADVNTIYEFLVFSEWVFLLRAGNVVNDLKRMLNQYLKQVGVRPVAESLATAGGEGALEVRARELVKSHKLNKVIPVSALSRCEVRKRHLQYLGFYGSVVLKQNDGSKMVFRFRNGGEWEEAWHILRRIGPKATLA